MERLRQQGNAIVESQENRGWIVGSFIPETQGLKSSPDVEIKWGQHKAGEKRDVWGYSNSATTATILIAGNVAHEFPDQTIDLCTTGDYVIWGPHVPHKWEAKEDSLTLSVRWPSAPGDIVEINESDQILSA